MSFLSRDETVTVSISANIGLVIERMRESAHRSGRDPSGIRFMAVTKGVKPDRVREALESGISLIGENYVQEAITKKGALAPQDSLTEWHMIGRLQTNKARHAVRLFDMVQSLDRIELAREINKQSLTLGKVTKVLIEVNTGQETTKSGVPLSQAIDLAKACSSLENISLRGLMTIPPWFDNPELSRPFFVRLRELRDAIDALAIPGIIMDELSMGMTNDYPIAVEEGSTIVRIGRGIFGERRA